jgi:hypothetical protein
MQILAEFIALGLVAAAIAGGAAASWADAKGFRGYGQDYRQELGGSRLGGSTLRIGRRHGPSYDHCWTFGRWVCAPRRR